MIKSYRYPLDEKNKKGKQEDGTGNGRTSGGEAAYASSSSSSAAGAAAGKRVDIGMLLLLAELVVRRQIYGR